MVQFPEPGDYNPATITLVAKQMARFILFIAVLAVSTGAPLIRYAAPAPALTVAAARVCLAGLLLTLMAPGAWGHFRRLSGRERWFVIGAGALLGAHFGTWVTSLYLTSTAASVALVATQPMFAALFAGALGDAIHRREVVGMSFALLGCVVLGGGELFSGSTDALIGDALAIAGAATAAGYLLIGRRLRTAMPLAAYLALVNTFAGFALLACALVAGAQFVGFAPRVYIAMALAAIIPSLIGHTLLNWSVRRAPAHLVALAILGEPIGASLMTLAAFGEVPPSHAVLGGGVILLGIALGFRARRPKASSEPGESGESTQFVEAAESGESAES